MVRILTILSLVALLASCTYKSAEKAAPEPMESPVISSLKDSGLTCFSCHSYEKFALDETGKFSHRKHIGFGVHCNQCHTIEPHKEISLNKDTCNGCHNLKTFTFAASGLPVTFSHVNHTKKFSCGECHPKLFQMKRGGSRIVMADMYKGESCGKCHNGTTAFSVKDCAKCHSMTALKKDFTYPSGDMSAAVFSHDLHTSMFECSFCHTAIFKYKKGGSGITMDAIYQNKFCGKCHDGQSAFGSSECQRCHK